MSSHEESGHGTFMDIPPFEGKRSDAAFHVYTVPFEKSSTYARDASLGPAALIEASWQVERFDMEIGMQAHKSGIVTDRSLDNFCDGEYSKIHEALERAASESILGGSVPFFIGGEHTISRGPIAAALKAVPNLTVVNLDAHADMRDSYQDNPDNHACVMRRVLGLEPSPASLVEIAVRSMSPEEDAFCRANERVSLFPAHRLIRDKVRMEDIMGNVSGNVYLSIDLDALDPSEIPGVGSPEPGGISWKWTVDFIDSLCASARIVAFDIVELMPLENCVRSQFLAAKLAYRTMGLILKHRHASSK